MNNALLSIFAVLFLFGGFFLIIFIGIEQEHRHKIELEKAKQGIFEQSSNKEPFYKKYCKQIIFVIILSALIIGICYIFNVPSDLPKYIIDIIK